jgi:ubiquinone/menaquinone biosynthesis C-methylase UbiE
MLLELDRAGYEVVGLDLSRYMIRLAGRRLRRAGATVPLIRGKAQALPFTPAAFATLLATFPAPFIVSPATIASMFRVLAPGGRVVIVPEARLEGGGPIRRFLEWLYAITGQRLSPAGDSSLSQPWQEAEDNFLAAGFRVTLNHIPLESSDVTVIIAEKHTISG